MNFDATLMVRLARERLEKTSNTRHRRMLEQVIAHLEGEVKFDLDDLMSAYRTEKPRYRIWEDGEDVGPKGRTEIRRWYAEQLAARGLLIEYDIETIVVDDRTVVTDGFMTAILPGYTLQLMGADPVEPSRIYSKRFRNCILWPFDADAALLGEEFHISGFTGRSNLKLLGDDEIPPAFQTLSKKAAAAASAH